MDELTKNNIVLSLPINPAYVSAVCMTASSIADKIGLSAHETETVINAVSGACLFIIKNAPASEKSFFNVVFAVYESTLGIMVSCSNVLSGFDKSALPHMDEIIYSNYPGAFSIKMIKNHNGNFFK